MLDTPVPILAPFGQFNTWIGNRLGTPGAAGIGSDIDTTYVDRIGQCQLCPPARGSATGRCLSMVASLQAVKPKPVARKIKFFISKI